MFRDSFYSFLYDSKSTVLKILNSLVGFNVLVSLALLILENGFYLSPKYHHLVFLGFRLVFILFVLRYIFRFLYEFHKIAFLKETWIELSLTLIIIISPLITISLGYTKVDDILDSDKVTTFAKWYHILISAYIIYIVGFNFVKASAYINSLAIKPASTFIFSFILLISFGTGMLMLPQMTVGIQGANFLDALFTSTSASCVTGLIIVDTATYFTHKGHLVLLFLMQFGGIGIVSFVAFFAMFLQNTTGIKQRASVQEFMDSESVSSAQNLLKEVIKTTLLVELISATAIFFTWGNHVQFDSLYDKLFYSIFHAVSAFCNAGFSLFSNGLYEIPLRNSLLLHMVIALTIITGSLGFSAIQDLFSPSALKERLVKPWKDWKLSTKIAVHSSFVLVLIGLIVIFLVERLNPKTLQNLSPLQALIASFFQSVTTRTAGFNTIDFSAITDPTLIFMIFLMFIGASSGSTGGGIKTSTFVIITASAFAAIKGKSRVDIGKKNISNELIFRAFSIFIFAASFNLFMIFVLSITESEKGFDLIDLVFEQVSAFATVGVSTGVTASLTVAGKYLIIFSMFLGRIGTLTLALALSSRVDVKSYKYPSAHLMVG